MLIRRIARGSILFVITLVGLVGCQKNALSGQTGEIIGEQLFSEPRKIESDDLEQNSGTFGSGQYKGDSNSYELDKINEIEANTGLHNIGHVELKYAEGFSVGHFEGGYDLITIPESGQYFIIPEAKPVAGGAEGRGTQEEEPGRKAYMEEARETTDPSSSESIVNTITSMYPETVVIQKPINNIYIASSSVMDFFDKLGCLDSVTMTSTKPSDWSLENIRGKVESGEIAYIGKYSSPDYELLLDGGCGLAIENTMIYHNPEAKELIEKMDIPVLVERSSYESHPLGRMEWIKLYGCLMDKEEEAGAFFDRKLAELNESLERGLENKKVLFFYITAGGYVNVRKPGDYIAKMIELAGGEYALSNLETEEENSLSTMNISLEDFYLKGKDADILVYNSTIDGGVKDLSQLLEKSALLKDFKAVKEGEAFCTNKDMFQETTGACDMIAELSKIINGRAEDTDSMKYLYRLE